MSYKIIVDSCGELFDDMKADGRFQSVPLELEVDGYHVVMMNPLINWSLFAG